MFFSQGNITEIDKFEKNHGKTRQFNKLNRVGVYIGDAPCHISDVMVVLSYF